MNDDDKLLRKRLAELSSRSAARGIWTYSEFLTMAEQSILLETPELSPFLLFGGYDGAERRLACFGSEETVSYKASPPVSCLAVEPVSRKFAETLTHRDHLGALMSLGIRRETLGDIVVTENRGLIFCLQQVAGYIAGELREVRRTPVKCFETETPADLIAREPEERELVVQSPRADALVAAVYGLSRGASQELFEQRRVFVNSRETENVSRELVPGDVVSVRGRGRFIYDGAVRGTKKGRLRVAVRVY